MVPLRPSFTDILSLIPLEKIKEFHPDIVVGIERGGLPVAGIISYWIGVPLMSVRASLYNDDKPAKKVYDSPKVETRDANVLGRKVLLVDDVSNSGVTLSSVKDALVKQGAKNVNTFVLYGKSDFSETNFVKCIRFPWEPG